MIIFTTVFFNSHEPGPNKRKLSTTLRFKFDASALESTRFRRSFSIENYSHSIHDKIRGATEFSEYDTSCLLKGGNAVSSDKPSDLNKTSFHCVPEEKEVLERKLNPIKIPIGTGIRGEIARFFRIVTSYLIVLAYAS